MHFRAHILLGVTLILYAVLLSLHNTSAREIQKAAPISREKYQYGHVHDLVVGDVPNHILRVFEIHRTYPDNPPVINGPSLWSGGPAALLT